MSFYSIISQQFRGSLKRNMPQHFKLPQHDWNKCVAFPRWLLSRGQWPPGSITPRTFFGKTVPLLYSYIPLGNKYEIINTELFFWCCSWSLGSEPYVNLNKSLSLNYVKFLELKNASDNNNNQNQWDSIFGIT